MHVSQDFQLHLIISPPFCRKHIDYHICASLFNYPAILYLFKCLNRHLKLLPAQNARNYTTPKPNLVLVFAFLGFTALWIYTTPKPNDINKYSPLGFTALWIYTTPKPQKRIFEVATSVCITEHSIAFYYITSLFSEKHIECHACANLFNYPAILHLFKCSNRHLKLLPAQNARNYTTPKLI